MKIVGLWSKRQFKVLDSIGYKDGVNEGDEDWKMNTGIERP